MAQSISYGSITISDITDITDVYLEYCMAADTYKTAESIESKTTWTDPERDWSPIYPDWQSGYQIWVREVTKKEGLPDKPGTPYLDKAINQTNYTINALDSKLKAFFWPGDSRYSGAYAVSKIPNINLDVSNIETYGYNVGIRPTYVTIGYNATPVIQLDGTDGSLNIYQLPIIDNNTKMVTQSGALAMKLTGDALNFYGSNQSIPDSYLGTDGLITIKGIIGGWMIDPTSLHTINKNSWNDNQKGIYIGTYLDEAGNNSYVIAGGPNTESKGRDGGLETTPYWYIKDDGSAKFGEMTLTSGGLLSVPAASVSGTLTSSQINVNDLAAISANIGATIGQGSLTNTLGVSIEKEYVLSTDTRINPLKTYYTKNLDTDIYSEVIYNLADNDDPSSEYKLTDDTRLEPGGAVRYCRENNFQDIYFEEDLSGLELLNFLKGIVDGQPLFITPGRDVDYEFITKLTCYIEINNDSTSQQIYAGNFDITKYTSSLFNSQLQVNLENQNVDLTALLENKIEKVEISSGFSIILSDDENFKNVFAIVQAGTEETDQCNISFAIKYSYETFPRYKQYYQRQVGSILYKPINYVTNAELNPYENDYYEIEPWYEKVDSSYITLESHKNVYLLTNDETAKSDTKYYEYSIEYGLTEDAEKKENKDYYILNNRNIYSLTNDTEVITETINDEKVVKSYFTIKLTTDTTFVEGKDYCELINDGTGNSVYRVVEVSQKNQSPVNLGYYEANKIEGLKEHDPIGQNYYESNYYSWYSKIENDSITDPSAAKWFEQIASYKPIEVITEGANPKELNWYIIRDQYNVQLKLQNAQMNISSNNTDLLTVKSEKENDINITNMEVTGRLKIGNIELIPFNNGLAIQAGGH